MDVPWNGVREGRVTCFFLCSRVCTVTLCVRLHVRMGISELLTDYGHRSYKRGTHTGTRGVVSSLATRVRVVNGCEQFLIVPIKGNGKVERSKGGISPE